MTNYPFLFLMKHLSFQIPQIHCGKAKVLNQCFINPQLPERKLNTMPEPQQNQRNQADRAFTESLKQLNDILLQDAQIGKPEAHQDTSSSYRIDAHAWEDAAADLDQFFGDVQPREDG